MFFSFFLSGLVKIQQELLHLHPTYNLLSARSNDSDRQLADLKQKFTFVRGKFEIESVYGHYALESLDIFAHAFTLTKKWSNSSSCEQKILFII